MVAYKNTVIVFGGCQDKKWLNDVVVLDTDRWVWSHPHTTGVAPLGEISDPTSTPTRANLNPSLNHHDLHQAALTTLQESVMITCTYWVGTTTSSRLVPDATQ